MRIITILSFILFTLSANFASAQFVPGAYEGTQPVIKLQPSYPQPNEPVSASINLTSERFFGSSLTWVLDGNEIPNSKNKPSIEIVAGDNSSTQELDVVITKPNGQRSVISTIIKPVWLDVVIEAQTHVPEFFQGRPLPSIGSSVVATAILGNPELNPSDLIYNWSVNRKGIDNGSIRGRNVTSFETPIGEWSVLTLEVSKLNGEVVASRSINVPSAKPKILFYEINTLTGIRSIPVGKSLTILGNSFTVRAEPLHLDSRVYNDPEISEWEIDGTKVRSGGNNPYEVVLEKTGSERSVYLNYHVRSLSQILQGDEKSVKINL